MTTQQQHNIMPVGNTYRHLPSSLVVQQLQQQDVGLAPYLADLDISDALESFSKFADMIQLRTSLEDNQQHLSSDWSPCSSTWSTSTSGASSPAPSAYFSSSASSTSSTSSGKSKLAKGGRRTKNASAADRYRKRLKGRDCGLAQQMERELERNARLRRDLESKLALYREFIQLLAFNTSKSDADLAQLGSRSLTTILEALQDLSSLNNRPSAGSDDDDDNDDYDELLIDEDIRFELEAQQARFKRIISDSHHQR